MTWQNVLLEAYSPDEVGRAAQRLNDLETELLNRRAELSQAEDAHRAIDMAIRSASITPEVRTLLVTELDFRYHALEQLRGKTAQAERRVEETRLYLLRAYEVARVMQWRTVR